MFHVTRTYRYFSVHRLWSADLSEEDNRRIYGKCSNPNGHGHEYEIQVTVAVRRAEPRDWTVNPARLDAAAKAVLDPLFDHADLERTVGPGPMTSGENLSRTVFAALRAALTDYAVARVAVVETPKNAFEVCEDAL